MSSLQLWPGFETELDRARISDTHVPVKGVEYHNPGRFIDIYESTITPLTPSIGNIGPKALPTDEEIRNSYLTFASDLPLHIGRNIPQPPFVWQKCSGEMMLTNFIYNTNAIYRILCNLRSSGRLSGRNLDRLLDSACLVLAHIYKSNKFGVIPYINNNINMFLISRVVEHILGRSTYNSCAQEPVITQNALRAALHMAPEHTTLSTLQLMSLALGKGVAFLESSLTERSVKQSLNMARETAYHFVERPLAIDDRRLLIDRIDGAAIAGKDIRMCVVLDDTAESVDDLLWIQSLVGQYSKLTVDLLLNKAQVSINFAAPMMSDVLLEPSFSLLASRLGKQVMITETFCPLISFQSNVLDPNARQSIEKSDFVFVKGMNFFETLQLPNKDVFYSFVVCGPTSRTLTGLKEMDAVFCFVPMGSSGYRFGGPQDILPLLSTRLDFEHTKREKKQ